MEEICNFCRHQERANGCGDGDIQCGAAQYHPNGGYGHIKSIAFYDADLNNLFKSRHDGDTNVLNMAELINQQSREIIDLKSEIEIFKNRLTKI